ncbi:FAD-containing oxidoreductase [Siccirubricoccus sp. G192]|uniref:FAD-containing oxidoreductase n=1 Tax=Siccirubricoccus sp. G192 TaxID=2849651 RepID=UPI001C2BCEA6|nr:FAD-containing oxidoreductase [Siccirubricoccus sp. G192]MBV1799907.1 FAD-containing oxidoreductase [Siccirubricoccus sp. G192]
MTRQFEAIVIGSGQAGPPLAVRLARSGLKTALIEREHLGGTCVNDGCIPTKTLVASARVAQMARRAAEYGVGIGGAVSVDMAAVKARKDRIVQASLDSLAAWIGGTPDLTLVWGSARFTGPHEVAVGNQRLSAPRIFINTGGRPLVPDWPGLAGMPYLTNTSMMAMDRVPDHLIVVGGSYIGLEFAQMYRRFGARVSVLEMADRLIAREDPDVSDTLREILEAEGIACHLGVRDVAVAQHDGGIRLDAALGSGPISVSGSHLLLSVGRRPNVEDLDLAAAGVTLDARGYIEVDDQLRTSAEGIWALGDVNGRGAFTHTSYNDYEIVAANLLDNDPRRVSDRIPAYALFTDPPLGRVGMTEAEARATGRPVLKGHLPMTRVGRARERGETQGFMKVLVDRETKLILGAALLCVEGDEIVHSLLDVMAAKAPCTVIQRSMHIHPTVSELIPTMLGDLHPLDQAAGA